ncbi:hypothetical protein MMPV_001990 [Pyropia vietnamensis]
MAVSLRQKAPSLWAAAVVSAAVVMATVVGTVASGAASSTAVAAASPSSEAAAGPSPKTSTLIMVNAQGERMRRSPLATVSRDSKLESKPRRIHDKPLLAASAALGAPFADVAADFVDPDTFVNAAFPLLAADAMRVSRPPRAAAERTPPPMYALTSVKGETMLVGVRRVLRQRSVISVTLRVVRSSSTGASGGADSTFAKSAAAAAAARSGVARCGTKIHVEVRALRRQPAGGRQLGPRPTSKLRIFGFPARNGGGRDSGDGSSADDAALATHLLAVMVEGMVTALGRRYRRADCERTVRSLDGGCNNLGKVTMGATTTEMLQLSPRWGADARDFDKPTGVGRPSARAISNALSAEGGEPPRNARRLNDLTWAFAQVLDHDLSLSSAPSAGPYAVALPIPVPADDTVFEGGATLGFFRTFRARRPRASATGGVGWVAAPAGIVPNELTSWIDASHVYGGDRVRAAALRTGTGGRLRTSGPGGRYLPLNGAGPGGVGVTLEVASEGAPAASQVVAGDVRAGENVLLTAFHTVWLRAHNRWADVIAAALPTGTPDEAIYQLARKAVGIAQAKITYEEWLPALLGPIAAQCMRGPYNASVDASVSVFFSTAAFRVGHTLVSNSLARRDEAGRPLPPLPLASSFFRSPEFLDSPAAGIDAMLRGAAAQVAGEVDVEIVPALRNLLFGGHGRSGTDLFALNIQRGRDHRLPSYNNARKAYNLSPARTFYDITTNADTAERLAAAYRGNLNDVDAFVGGLAEDHVPGGSVGPLFAAALVDQFHRLAVGDRFFYHRPAAALPPALVKAVPELQRLAPGEPWGLADLLVATTGVTAASLPQGGVFFADPPKA